MCDIAVFMEMRNWVGREYSVGAKNQWVLGAAHLDEIITTAMQWSEISKSLP